MDWQPTVIYLRGDGPLAVRRPDAPEDCLDPIDLVDRAPRVGMALPGAAIEACLARALADQHALLKKLKRAKGPAPSPDVFLQVGAWASLLASPPALRSDTCAVRGQAAPAVVRVALFEDWELKVEVRYDPRRIDRDGLLRLFDQAGAFTGLGVYRPSLPTPKGIRGTGGYGVFRALPN